MLQDPLTERYEKVRDFSREKITVTLGVISLANILDTIYSQNRIEHPNGNFWAAIQHLDQQFYDCYESMINRGE